MQCVVMTVVHTIHSHVTHLHMNLCLDARSWYAFLRHIAEISSLQIFDVWTMTFLVARVFWIKTARLPYEDYKAVWKTAGCREVLFANHCDLNTKPQPYLVNHMTLIQHMCESTCARLIAWVPKCLTAQIDARKGCTTLRVIVFGNIKS